MRRRQKIFIILIVLILAASFFSSRPRAEQFFISRFYQQEEGLPLSELFGKASDFEKAGQKDSALLYYSLVANRYYEHKLKDRDIPTVIDALSLMGRLYHLEFYDFRQSFNYLTLAESLSLEYDYHHQLPNIYLQLAGISFTDGDVHQSPDYISNAVSLYKKSYEEALNQKQYGTAVKSFINLINFSTDSVAHASIKEEIKSFESLQDPSVPLLSYALMLTYGSIAQISKDYDSAIGYYKQMPELVADSIPGALRYKLVADTRISDVYFQSGNEALGLEYLHKVENTATADSMIDLQVDTYRALEDYYSGKGDETNALHYHLLYLEAKDAMLEKHNLESVKYAQFLNELNTANEQIQKISYQRRMQNRILIGVSIFALILLILVSVIIYNYRLLQEKNKSIYRQMARSLDAEQKRQVEEPAIAGVELPDAEPATEDADTGAESDIASKYKSSILTEEEKDSIYHKIQEAMQDVDLFCNDSFSLQVLSDRINERSRLVSQVINERYKSNFPSFVNDYRIREACRRIMNQEAYGHLSLAGIGESVGIKSRSQFSSIFKKVVGMTAAEYQKEARK